MATFTSTVGTSVGTVATFEMGIPGAESPAEAQVSVRKVPWGSNVIVDLGGQGPRRLVATVLIGSAQEWANLLAVRGDQGTLVWSGGTHTAVLMSVTGQDWRYTYHTKARCEWLIVS
jgi:hypothetical protein